VFDIATVVDALRRIGDGETVLDPTIVLRLVGRRRRKDPLAVLSTREREVLGLITEGMSYRAIAARWPARRAVCSARRAYSRAIGWRGMLPDARQMMA
jgi:hypothetical protein